MGKEFYRFRKVENLIGKYDELNLQSLYFAPPHDLNDPMEGYRDVFWQGDKILWDNLFKHYVFCLEHVVSLYNISGEDFILGVNDIPVSNGYQDLPTDQYRSLMMTITETFIKLDGLKKLISYLVDKNRAVKQDELYFYLSALNIPAIKIIYDCHIAYGLSSKDNNFNIDIDKILEGFLPDNLYALLEKKESSIIDGFFNEHWMVETQNEIANLFNKRIDDKNKNKNKNFIFLYFPKNYLKKLNDIAFPAWYTACFMTECKNSSAWGYYGDNHKGCCLIYESEDNEAEFSLPINIICGIDGNGYVYGEVKYKLHPVRYIQDHENIDFFKTLGNVRMPIRSQMWLTDGKGGCTSTIGHFNPHNQEEWRKKYWDLFIGGVTVKSTDWKYENEYRLVLNSQMMDFSKEENRKVTYDFKSLKGIIFGINTSLEDKVKIISIIKSKCIDNDIKGFRFFQAYFSSENGCIESYEMELVKSLL